MFYRGWLVSLNKHPDARDSHDATSIANLLNRFICLQSWMIRHQGPAIRVRNQDRLLGNFECVEGHAITTMGDVNRHAHFVHALNDRDTEIRNTLVPSFG